MANQHPRAKSTHRFRIGAPSRARSHRSAPYSEEAARSDEEMTELYAQGVGAGQRALGKRAFLEDVGHFWGVIQTRPYMRARHGLAQCLWRAGDRDGAIEHFQEMLRLNPNDNQGVRYQLAACLLEAGKNDLLGDLLRQYDDDGTAVWGYSTALLAFRLHGDAKASRSALTAARKQNPHIPAYLLGNKKVPRHLPDYIGFGDENEAVAYVAEHASAWAATTGATEWLRAQDGEGAPRKRTTQKKKKRIMH